MTQYDELLSLLTPEQMRRMLVNGRKVGAIAKRADVVDRELTTPAPARSTSAASLKRGARIPEVHPLFAAMLRDAGIPMPVPEYRFHPTRKWRMDYAWPAFKVAMEVDGGAWTGGRHTRGKGFIADQEKRNAATAAGWRVFNVTPDTLATNHTIALLAGAIRPAGAEGGEG